MDHAAGAAAGSGTQQSPNRPPPPPRRDNFAADNAAGAARRGNNGLMFEEPPPEKGVERDMHGFKITGEEYIRKYKEWKPLHQKKEAERMQKWRDMFIKFPGDSYKNRQQFKKLVRDGIPDSSRGEVWMDISGAKKKKVSNPGDYAKMLTTSKKETSPDAANQIELDIPRTFPEHESFRGSEETAMTIKLRNVLMAYANRNKVVGYCQGMNFIVGIMLLFLDEESAFWLLCCLLEEILPKDYYAQDLSGCNVDLRVFKHLLNMHHNKLMKRCEEAGLGVEFFGLEWFIALFGKTMPIESTLRVWDCMFKEGNKIIFRIGLGLIAANEKHLLAFKEPHELFQAVQGLGRQQLDVDSLLKPRFLVPQKVKKSKVEDLRKQYREEVCKERQQRQANKAKGSGD